MGMTDQEKAAMKAKLLSEQQKNIEETAFQAKVVVRLLLDKIHQKKYKMDYRGRIAVNLYWWQFNTKYTLDVYEIIQNEGYQISHIDSGILWPVHTFYLELMENTEKSDTKSVEDTILTSMGLTESEEIWQAFAKEDNTEEYCWIYMWYQNGRVTKTKIYKDIKPLHKIEEIEVGPIEWNEKDFGQRFMGKRGPKWAMNSEGKFTIGGK